MNSVLILGVSGMLGNSMFRVLRENPDLKVYGTVRSESVKRFFHPNVVRYLLNGVDVENYDSLMQAFALSRPDVVINCIGLVKQLVAADDPLHAIPVNSLLPHRLSRICKLVGSRLIHISTDCVFSGEKGGYRETDPADAQDLYGRSKSLGEVNYSHTLTLRTSIIGHGLQNRHGLIDWFMSQQDICAGYTRAFFSGVPTVILAEIIRDVIMPRDDLYGLYHVAAKPISKYDLLKLVAKIYEKQIELVPDDSLVIDRTLDARAFSNATGYIPPDWNHMIELMCKYR